MGWKPANRIAVTLHNFKANGIHQLTIHVGDLLYILEESESGEWYRGYLFYEPSRRGIFPASYVSMKESTNKKTGSQSFVVPAGDELIVEATQGLREWKKKLRELYIRGSRERWRPLFHAMEEVVNWRRTLLSSNTTIEALQDTRTKLSATIDEINRQSGCPLTPRNPLTGAAVDCQLTNILDLWKLHRDRRTDSTTSDHGTLRHQRQDQPHSHLHHLYMRVDAVDHTFGEDCEIFFFLAGGGRDQLSERYFIAMEKGAVKKTPTIGDRKSCVFTDLGSKDMEREMYLICQIIRKGKMLLDKKHHSTHTFRRPYACGVLDVRSVLQAKEIVDGGDHHKIITMPLYLCGTNHESNFATFHMTVIQKTGAKGGQKPGCAITLSLRAFHRKQLATIRMDFPMLFTMATETVHKLGFPDVILPGDARNDIYVTLETGSFSKGTKTAERNVEVIVNVMDKSGTIISKSIVWGAGTPATDEYISSIYYHNNTPRWKETFKLVIPFEKVPEAHLRIVFRHLAKDESRDKAEKSFSFAYMKIMNNDGSIISDGTHELYVYETGNKKWADPSVYLNQASGREELIQSTVTTSTLSSTMKTRKTLGRGSSSPATASRSFREVVTISTLTCSTKLTQRIELLLLLKWRQKSQDLSVVLKNLVHVGGEEVVKFLQDTLDCLFEILNDNNDKYGELVFEALVAIFGLMSDDRYHHFTTVLDIYIEKHFSALLAYKFLLASFKKSVQNLMLSDRQYPKLIKILQSMPYLFKFIVQSSHLHQKHSQHQDPAFISEFSMIFTSFNKLMDIPETRVRGVHGVQKVVLEYFPSVLPELVKVFTHTEIAIFITGLLDAMKNTMIAIIPLQKLIFMSAIIQSPVKLLGNEDTRKHLVPALVTHLIAYMNLNMVQANHQQDDKGNQEVINCVGQLLSCLSNHEIERSMDDVRYYVLPLMQPLLMLCKILPQTNKLSFPNMVNFLMLMNLMTEHHFKEFFQSLETVSENTFGPFILDLMAVLHTYVSKPAYPEDWCTLYLLQNRALAHTLTNTSNALVDYTLHDRAFAPNVWDKFFLLCAKFLTQHCLELERLSDYQKHLYQQQYGDVRVSVSHNVISLWHKLGDKKGNFIPNLVKPFLEISLIKHKELRCMSLPLIMDIMVCEQQASFNFKRVETEVFDKIDELIASGRGDEEYRELFKDILHPLCTTNNLGITGEVFISSVSHLIGLLLDYRNVSSDEGHTYRRMGCMLNLLNFYREIEKEELYIRYIYKLAELHKKDQSFTEAGFTLLLRAKGLEWSIEPVPPEGEGRFAQEIEQKKVKEELYKEVIDLFDKGQAWEHGIPLCKELCNVYENEIQYIDLANTLQREAEFFQKIVRELRVEPEYFMVGSYGKGFPLFLRNKIFIHRGQPYERLTSFIKRLTDEYSTAQLLKTTKPPDDDIKNSTGMYIQVRSVQTIPEEQKRFEGKTVPDAVSRYYKANDVCKFRYDRPFHRGEKRKDCEIATLWLERTNFTIIKSFPGEMAWFEVSERDQVELDPLDIAIETVSTKTTEVRQLTVLQSENATLNINPLSMLLSGLIDAAVGGGIKNYRIVFFNDTYTANNPGDQERVTQLKQLIEEQLSVLRKGLDVHGKRIGPTLEGMQQNLERTLELMKYEVFPERRKKTQPMRSLTLKTTTAKNAPLPPIPQQQQQQQDKIKYTQTLASKGRRNTGKSPHRISLIPPASPPSLQRSATTTVVDRDIIPKLPSPYQPPQRSDFSDRKRLSGSHDDVMSDDEEEDELGTYERVEDFLCKPPGYPPSVHPPSGHSPPGPITPAIPSKYTPTKPGKMVHDYTPVKVTDSGEVKVGQDHEENDKVLGALPLKTSPKPKSRSASVVTGPLPQRTKERSPSLPHINPFATSPSGRGVAIPPEPSSPPPSPPTLSSGRTPPTRGIDDTDGGEQPKLPPKKRGKSYSEIDGNKWHGSPSTKIPAPVQEENVYGFDNLIPLASQSFEDSFSSVSPGTPIISPGHSHSPSPAAQPPPDDVYSHLQAMQLPKPHPQAPPTSDGEIYFDILTQKPPPPIISHLSGSDSIPQASSGPDSIPPPVPMKKNKPQRQTSTSEDSSTPEQRPIPRPRTDTHHPVPVPRTSHEAVTTPARPPKPGAPLLPPKPKPAVKPVWPAKETDIQAPPRPAKNKP